MRIARRPQRWLLVAGLPRSGTTFVGRILSTPLIADYIHEPFNPHCGVEGFDQILAYTRPGLPNEPQVRKAVEELKSYEGSLKTGYFRRDALWRIAVKAIVGSRGPFYYRLAKLNPFHQVAVVKEPVGCLLLQYLVEEHDFEAILVVRHPLGLVQSFQRLRADARQSLKALGSQPWFADDFLDAEDLSLLHREWDDPRAAAAVFWRLGQRALGRQAVETGTRIVRHEDLCANPAHEFRGLFERLNLPWSCRVERRIDRETKGIHDLARVDGPTQQLRRDSAALAQAVIQRAPIELRRQVWDLTGPVACQWYDESSFAI